MTDRTQTTSALLAGLSQVARLQAERDAAIEARDAAWTRHAEAESRLVQARRDNRELVEEAKRAACAGRDARIAELEEQLAAERRRAEEAERERDILKEELGATRRALEIWQCAAEDAQERLVKSDSRTRADLELPRKDALRIVEEAGEVVLKLAKARKAFSDILWNLSHVPVPRNEYVAATIGLASGTLFELDEPATDPAPSPDLEAIERIARELGEVPGRISSPEPNGAPAPADKLLEAALAGLRTAERMLNERRDDILDDRESPGEFLPAAERFEEVGDFIRHVVAALETRAELEGRLVADQLGRSAADAAARNEVLRREVTAGVADHLEPGEWR